MTEFFELNKLLFTYMMENDTLGTNTWPQHLISKITANLTKLYGIGIDEFQTYKYCGRHREDGWDHKTASGEIYFKQLFGNRSFPKIRDSCICDQQIKINCYVTKDLTCKDGLLIVVGSCCIEKFLESGLSKTCSLCSTNHQNRKDNLCTKCRNRLKWVSTKKLNELPLHYYYKILAFKLVETEYGIAKIVTLFGEDNTPLNVFLPKRYNDHTLLHGDELAYIGTTNLANGYIRYEIDIRHSPVTVLP